MRCVCACASVYACMLRIHACCMYECMYAWQASLAAQEAFEQVGRVEGPVSWNDRQAFFVYRRKHL